MAKQTQSLYEDQRDVLVEGLDRTDISTDARFVGAVLILLADELHEIVLHLQHPVLPAVPVSVYHGK